MSRIILKNSTVAAKVPLTTDLNTGELAVNAADGNVFLKTTGNAIVDIAPVKLSTIFPFQLLVANIAALKTTSKLLCSSIATRGYYLAGDGGEGEYWFDSTDTTSVDNGVDIHVAADGGRWKLRHRGEINARQAGAKGDGVTVDRVRLQAGLDRTTALGLRSFRIDYGTYMVDQSVLYPANIRIWGSATIKAVQTGYTGTIVAPFGTTGTFTRPLFRNKNFMVAAYTDANVRIEGLTFDFGTLVLSGGGLHAVSGRWAKNISVVGCTFRGGEDAVAFVHCDGTYIGDSKSYDASNCAWDHWEVPRNAVVQGCYAESANSVQMVNFNSEPTADLTTTGLVGDGFTMTGCEFNYTGTTSGSYMQIEPLIDGNGIRNFTITGNIFRNISLAMRRNTSNGIVSGNVFYGGVAANVSSMIMCNPLTTDTPSSISIVDNIFVDPRTSSGNVAVILMYCNGFVIDGNTVSGANHYLACATSTYTGSMGKNLFSTGTSGQVQKGTGGYPAWTALTMQNAWVAYGAPRSPLAYYVDYDQGRVYLRGSIKSGTIATVAATLAVQFAPEQPQLFPCCANGSFGVLVVDTNGTITPSGGSNLDFSVDGISWRFKQT